MVITNITHCEIHNSVIISVKPVSSTWSIEWVPLLIRPRTTSMLLGKVAAAHNPLLLYILFYTSSPLQKFKTSQENVQTKIQYNNENTIMKLGALEIPRSGLPCRLEFFPISTFEVHNFTLYCRVHPNLVPFVDLCFIIHIQYLHEFPFCCRSSSVEIYNHLLNFEQNVFNVLMVYCARLLNSKLHRIKEYR